MKATRRAAPLAGALLMVALGIATSRLAAAHADAALGDGSLWANVIQVGAAVAATAAGLRMITNRRMISCGVLLTLTGPAILLTGLPAQDSGSAFLFTAALAGGQLAPVLAGSAALASPVAPMRRLDWAIIALSLAVAGAIRGLVPAAVFDPHATGCFTCPANLAEVRSDPALYAALGRWGLALTIAAGIGLAARAGSRLFRAPRIVRLISAPVILGGMGAALLSVAAAVHAFQLPTPEVDPILRMTWLATCCCVAIMATDVAAGRLRARWLAGKVSRAVVAALPDPESLQKALADSIGDRDLALVFPRDDGTVVDATGLPISDADWQPAVIRVTRGESAIAEIRYRQDLAGVSQQLVAAARAAGLAIEHVAAGARLRAELTELARSRRRIVELGDSERQRLERDLHDGAQQRLIALQVMLEMAASAAESARKASYAAARQDVGAALEDLRDLAHGIYPAALTDEGLGVALRTLAETSPVPLAVDWSALRRQPGAVEAAAYRMVADAIEIAGRNCARSAVTVSIRDSDEVLRLRLAATGLDKAAGQLIVAAAQDRIATADGSLTLTTTGGQTIIEGGYPVRVVIAEDMALLREGLARLLSDAGFDVVGQACDLPGLLTLVGTTTPDAALIDIKMPPTHTDEGLQAATAIRRQFPDTAVLLLSSYLESRYASSLLERHPASSGYLLKERVYDSAVLGDALRRVCAGECVIDHAIVTQLLGRRRVRGPLDELTEREQEILSLMAEGHSNQSICGHLVISPRTVESHVRSVFMKLGIAESPDSSRRVLAVLAYLQA
jgi:DNA-binding NarL/FixJ family response regulator/signal transduction histidine kinase